MAIPHIPVHTKGLFNPFTCRFHLADVSTYRSEIMGVAIIWIMMYHLYGSFPEIQFLCSLQRVGYCGVDLFFLLSGMGLFFSLVKNMDLKAFFRKRLLRIVPIWFTVVLIRIFLFYIPDHFLHSVCNQLMAYWYLIATLFFYVLAPCIFKIIVTESNYRACKFMLLIVLCFFLEFLVCLTETEYSLLFLATPRLPIYVLGFLLGYNIMRKVSIPFFVIGILFVIGCCFMQPKYSFTLEDKHNPLMMYYPMIMISPFLCCVVGLLSKKIKFIGKVLRTLGSYSLELYLAHILVLDFLVQKLQISSPLSLVILTFPVAVLIILLNKQYLKINALIQHS